MPTKKSNIIKRTLDPSKPPIVSEEQKLRLESIAALPEEKIDYSDAPVLSDAMWVKAASRLPQTKQQITLRLDAEVLEFFKLSGTRYQSRINSVLRSYVQAHKSHLG